MNKLNGKSYFIRLLVSFIALITITLLTSSVVIYRNYVNDSVKEDSAVSEQILSKTVFSADLVWDWASKQTIELFSNNIIFNLIYGDDITVMDELNAQKIMSYAMHSNPFIYSVYLYNTNMDMVYSSFSNGYPSDEFYDQDVLQLIKNRSLSKDFHFIPRTISYSHYSKEYKENVISLIMTENPSVDKSPEGALVINFLVSTLEDMAGVLNNSEDDYSLIVDRDGIVVSDSRTGMFLEDISDENYIAGIQNSGNTSGYFTEMIDGEKYLVTYVKSDKLDWSFVRLNEYQSLFQRTRGLRNLIMLFSILIFVIAAFLSVWISWRFYSPIGGLVRIMKDEEGDKGSASEGKSLSELEYISNTYLSVVKDSKVLKQQYRDNWRFLKKEFLKNLLNGHTHFYKNISKKLEEMEVDLDLRYFRVLVFRIDDYWTVFSKAYSEEDASLMLFAISNVAQEIISGKYKNEAVEMGDDVVAVIMNTCCNAEDESDDIVTLLVGQVQEAAGKHLGIGLSAGIGPCAEDPDDICMSYKTAVEISDYRLIFGKRSIIFPEMTEQNLNMEYSYSEETQKEILDQLRLKNYANISEKIGKFFAMLKLLSFSDIIMSIQRLIYESVRTLNSMTNNKNSYSYNNFQNEFKEMDTLDEIRDWMLDLFRQAVDDLNSGQQAGYKSVKVDYIEKTLEIINEEYSDPALTPDELASRLNLSVNYLRDIFKEIKGVSLSSYINEYKFEKAKELLLNTDILVSEISERVGFENQNYFFTFFKKYSGFTPTQFRNKSKIAIRDRSDS